MRDKIRNFLYFLLAVFFMAITAVKAGEIDSRMSDMRSEEIQAKESKTEELSQRVQILQKQLEEERSSAAKSQEKIWQDYTSSLEMERKKIKDQLTVLDERQKAFEEELNKKRNQDAVLLKSKEDDIKNMMLQMERLRKELEADRTAYETHKKELKSRPAAAAQLPGAASEDASAEVLGNRAIKVATGNQRELMGKDLLTARNVRPEYYVEIGDILDIDVWRVPDLSRSASVRPDGRISMPVVGDLDVVGLSLIQVRDLLTQKFSDYVWNPQVSISIRQFGGRKFIVLGEVGAPGVYRYQSDISIIEAIALAGGFRNSARSGKVMVIRGDIRKNPQVKVISANMENLLKRGMLTENIGIQPNDILYVGKNTIADTKEIMDNIVNPFFDTAIDYFVLHSAAREDHNS